MGFYPIAVSVGGELDCKFAPVGASCGCLEKALPPAMAVHPRNQRWQHPLVLRTGGCFPARRKAQNARQTALQQHFRLAVFSRRNNDLSNEGADNSLSLHD